MSAIVVCVCGLCLLCVWFELRPSELHDYPCGSVRVELLTVPEELSHWRTLAVDIVICFFMRFVTYSASRACSLSSVLLQLNGIERCGVKASQTLYVETHGADEAY